MLAVAVAEEQRRRARHAQAKGSCRHTPLEGWSITVWRAGFQCILIPRRVGPVAICLGEAGESLFMASMYIGYQPARGIRGLASSPRLPLRPPGKLKYLHKMCIEASSI